MSERRRPRLLLAVLVYNGRAFVPACLESVARLRDRSRTVDVDALVLDDASPAPGWSGELESLCEHLGLGYYCSPRNLGIPRNMNLALLRSLRAGHDYVLVANSDTVFPANLADQLVAVAPGVFVYHQGRGSTEAAGLIRRESDSVEANERILDLRYPEFRGVVDGFLRSDALDRMRARAVDRIITEAAQRWGYSVEASWLPRPAGDDNGVRFSVEPDGQVPAVRAEFLGFRSQMVLEEIGRASCRERV